MIGENLRLQIDADLAQPVQGLQGPVDKGAELLVHGATSTLEVLVEDRGKAWNWPKRECRKFTRTCMPVGADTSVGSRASLADL